MMRALVGVCGVTELEMLYSARNIQERARMKEQLEASLDRVDTPGRYLGTGCRDPRSTDLLHGVMAGFGPDVCGRTPTP
jgi:hypothetical protein